MGIGSKGIWHGYPDARAIGWGKADLNLLHAHDGEADDANGEADDADDDNDDDDDDDDNKWSTVTIDGKRGLRKGTKSVFQKHLSQLASTAVVASFTENGMCGAHGLSTLIPAVMISGDTFMVAIYDSVRDFMLISQEINYAAKVGGQMMLTPSAVLMLFTIMNHRYDIVLRMLCAYKCEAQV